MSHHLYRARRSVRGALPIGGSCTSNSLCPLSVSVFSLAVAACVCTLSHSPIRVPPPPPEQNGCTNPQTSATDLINGPEGSGVDFIADGELIPHTQFDLVPAASRRLQVRGFWNADRRPILDVDGAFVFRLARHCAAEHRVSTLSHGLCRRQSCHYEAKNELSEECMPDC